MLQIYLLLKTKNSVSIVIQKNRLKYLLKTFLQRSFLNILTCFFAIKKLAPSKKILVTAFVISFYLLISGCSDSDCVEADDFGEYSTATVLVPASSNSTYCKFDENYDLDPFNSLANHGERMKKCLTSQEINVTVDVTTKKSTTGCFGFAEEAYKQACIVECKRICSSITSGSEADLTKPSAEPNWTYTELPTAFGGISISPESQIFITANGTATLTKDVKRRSYYVIPNKNDFHLANIEGKTNASGSYLYLQANQGASIFVSGLFTAGYDSYGTIYKDPDTFSVSPAFNLSQRLIGYLEPVQKPIIQEIKTYSKLNKASNLGKYGGKLYYKIDSLYSEITDHKYEEDYLKDALTGSQIDLSKLNYCFSGNFNTASGKIVAPDLTKVNYNAINKEKLSCVVAIPSSKTANYNNSFKIPKFETDFSSFHIYATKHKNISGLSDSETVAKFSYYHKFYSSEGNLLPFKELKDKEIARNNNVKELINISVAEIGDNITIERSDTANTAPVFIVISAAKHNFINRIKLQQSGFSSIYNIKGSTSSCHVYARIVNDIADTDNLDKDDTDAESKIVEKDYFSQYFSSNVTETSGQFFVRKGQYLLLDWGDVDKRASCIDVPLLVNRYRPAAFCMKEISQTITNPFCTVFKEGSGNIQPSDSTSISGGNIIGCTHPPFDDCTKSANEDYCTNSCVSSCSSNSTNNNYCLDCKVGTSSASEITKRSCSILDGKWQLSNSSACVPNNSSKEGCEKCFKKLKYYSEMPYQIKGDVDYCYNIDNYKKTLASFRSETLDEKKKYLVGSITPNEAGNLGSFSFYGGSAFEDEPAIFKASALISPNQDSYLKFLILGNNYHDSITGDDDGFHLTVSLANGYLKISTDVSTTAQNGAFLEAKLCLSSECSELEKSLKPKIISIEGIVEEGLYLTCLPGYAFDPASQLCKCVKDCYGCGDNQTLNPVTKKCECNSGDLSWATKNGVLACYKYGKICEQSKDRFLLDDDIKYTNNIQVGGICTCPDGQEGPIEDEQDGKCFTKVNVKWGRDDFEHYKRESSVDIAQKLIKPDLNPSVLTETDSTYGVSADSNYFFDDSGVLTRITGLDYSFDCSVTESVVKGGDVYCHKNFYYDDTTDSATKTTRQSQIAKLQLAFRIYDPEVKNCKLFSTSKENDGVLVANLKATDSNQSSAACFYDIYHKGTCASQYYCDSVYANNTGFYNVRIKIKDPKTTSSNFVDSIIKKTNEITRGVFVVENGEYTKVSPPLFESLYINVIANSTYQGILRICLILFIAFFGTGYFLGTSKLSFQELMMMIFRLSFVMLMVTPGGYSYFNTLFVEPFQQVTDYLAFNFAAAFNDSPQIASAIERKDFFDRSILFSSSDDVLNIMISSATRKKIIALLFAGVFGWVYFLLIIAAFFKYIFAIGTTLLIYLTAQVIISLLFLFAPIIFIMLFFKQTRESFGSWLGSLFSLSLQQIFVIMAISFFNAVAYELIKMILSYRVCWDDVWSINIGTIRVTLLKFWTFAGLAPRDGSNLEPVTEAVEGFPSIFAVFSIYTVAYLAKEFVDIASSIAESIGGSFWGGASGGNISAAGLSNSLRTELGGFDRLKNGMSKIGRFAANQTAGRIGNKMLQKLGHKSEGEIKNLNAKQDKDIDSSRQMREVGDKAVSDYKINNANEFADMSAKDKRDTLEQVRNDAVNNFAKENNVGDKELERLRNFKPEYRGQGGLLHIGGAKLWSQVKGDNRSINERKIEKSYFTRSEAKKAMDKMSRDGRRKFLENVKNGKIRVDTGLLDIRRNSKIVVDKASKSLQQNLDSNGKLINKLSKATIDRNKAREEVIKDLVEKGKIPNKIFSFQKYSKKDAEIIEKELDSIAPDSYFDKDYFNSANTYKELENYNKSKEEDEKFAQDKDVAREQFQKEDSDASNADRLELRNNLFGEVVADFRQFKRDVGSDFKEFKGDAKYHVPNFFKRPFANFFGVGKEEEQKVAQENKNVFRNLLQQERADAEQERVDVELHRDDENLDRADLTRAERRELIVNSVSSQNVAEEKF